MENAAGVAPVVLARPRRRLQHTKALKRPRARARAHARACVRPRARATAQATASGAHRQRL
eukprot:208531-Pleurochrysis_carterae.AAC.1